MNNLNVQISKKKFDHIAPPKKVFKNLNYSSNTPILQIHISLKILCFTFVIDWERAEVIVLAKGIVGMKNQFQDVADVVSRRQMKRIRFSGRTNQDLRASNQDDVKICYDDLADTLVFH